MMEFISVCSSSVFTHETFNRIASISHAFAKQFFLIKFKSRLCEMREIDEETTAASNDDEQKYQITIRTNSSEIQHFSRLPFSFNV